MPTIALVNNKGGVGKSTTAVHFSRWLEKRRKQVMLVDADAHESSSRWLDNRKSNIEYLAFTDPNRILDSIPKLAEKTDFMVVDAPAGMTETTRAILLRADLAVCPCQPTTLDTDSTEQNFANHQAGPIFKRWQTVRSVSSKQGTEEYEGEKRCFALVQAKWLSLAYNLYPSTTIFNGFVR